MTVREALNIGADTLSAAGVPDPELDAALIMSDLIGSERVTLPLSYSETLPEGKHEAFVKLISARASREPLQYLLSRQSFYGREFYVDRRALIPRPETELLCEQALIALKGAFRASVLDMCTGSGAIAVTLKSERRDLIVSASDISADALRVAKRNAETHCADIAFFEGDLFEPLSDMRFDAIVCNPPYISGAACEKLQPEVMREPRLALCGGEDGLEFYARLASEAPRHLKNGGKLFLELGDGQAQSVRSLLDAAFTDIRILPDLQGLPRMALATLK